MPKITWPASWKTRSIRCRKFRIAPDGIATPLARTSSVRRARVTSPARRPTTSALTAAAGARRRAGHRPWTLLYAVLTPARQRDTGGRVADAQPGYPAHATVGHRPCTLRRARGQADPRGRRRAIPERHPGPRAERGRLRRDRAGDGE